MNLNLNGVLNLSYAARSCHVCYSYRIVMLHYDPLDQHNLAGVFLVYLPLLHHLLHRYVITSHVSYIESILLSAYRRSTTSFQLY